MLETFKKLGIVILGIMFSANVSFAQTGGTPSVFWTDPLQTEDIGGSLFTTSTIGFSNISNPSTLTTLVFVDDEDEFNPAMSVINVGTPLANGSLNFNAPNFPAGSFFIPVVVDTASYQGGLFNPYTSSGNFQTYIIGQVGFSTLITTTTTSPGGPGNNPPGGGPGSQGNNPQTTPTTATTSADPGIGQINLTSSIQNPLGQDFDIIEFFQKLFANLVKIAIPILVLFMVYSGFKFVEAQGNEEKLKKAKQNFLYVIIGAVLILGAWTIATALRGTVEELEQPIVFISQFINLI